MEKGIPSNEQLTEDERILRGQGILPGNGLYGFLTLSRSSAYGGHIPNSKPTESGQAGHSVTIVGYDEKRTKAELFYLRIPGEQIGVNDWIPMKYFVRQESADAPFVDKIGQS